MGQNSSLMSIKNHIARIETRDGKTFKISYHSLVEHILLLRKVINHPEMSKEGPLLHSFVKDYCKIMTGSEMTIVHEESNVPWQIEWIWHVHRLHPLAYLNDCNKQLSDGLVDRRSQKLIQDQEKKIKSKTTFSSNNNYSLFDPSINLTSAVIRQNDFLRKFQKHFFYSSKLREVDELKFLNLVQDYVSFIKLAKKNQMIVPTFDIDLIWHTHMRYPSHYHDFSIALCGFILDHDDSIESDRLTDAYQITADRWKQTYQSEYGKNIDRKHLQTSRYKSSCAMVVNPILPSNSTKEPSNSAMHTGCGSTCAYVLGTSDAGECGGDGGSGGCGGGCGGD